MPKILELKQHRAPIATSISNLAQRLTAVIVIYIDKWIVSIWTRSNRYYLRFGVRARSSPDTRTNLCHQFFRWVRIRQRTEWASALILHPSHVVCSLEFDLDFGTKMHHMSYMPESLWCSSRLSAAPTPRHALWNDQFPDHANLLFRAGLLQSVKCGNLYPGPGSPHCCVILSSEYKGFLLLGGP